MTTLKEIAKTMHQEHDLGDGHFSTAQVEYVTRLSRQAETHGKRVAYRAAHNGQPNGYRPVSEAELQASKNLQAATDDLKNLLDEAFGKLDERSVAFDTDAAIEALYNKSA